MADETIKLAKVAAAEASFRTQIASNIAGLLKGPDVPIALKALTVVILALFILYSFEFCILVIHVICAARHWVSGVEPMKYVYLFGAEGLSAALFAIPCVSRMDSFGHAKRLEAGLLPVIQAKGERHRGTLSETRAISTGV
jgi:hypothetical protein